MTRWQSLYLLMLILSWAHRACAQADSSEILDPPHNQTVPLNSTAVFTCATTGELLWQVDGIQFFQDSQRIINNFAMRGVRVTNQSSTSEGSNSTLLVEGTMLNNGTGVKCLAIELGIELVVTDESEVVTVQLYDRPMPPTDFTKSPVAPLTLNLTWGVPWSLPGVEITYVVVITNLNTGQELESEELRTTYFVFIGEEENHMYICDMYKFSVNARNDAGESDQSGMIISSLPRVPNITQSMQSLRHLVVFNDGNVSIKITFEHTDFCEDYPVQYYSVRLSNSETQEVTWAGPYFTSGNGDMEIHLDSSDGIQENTRYLFNIAATNEVGNGISEEEDIYTTDVQYAEVSLENHTVNITCTFAEGTEALGCHVELRPIYSRGNPLSVNISRANEATEVILTSLLAVCYIVLVRDWEADGTRGELDVPVDITLSEEGSEDLCFQPTGSSGITETTENSSPPTSGQESSSSRTSIIVGGVSGGVAVLIVVVVVLIVTVLCYYKRKIRKGFITTENNPAYELPQLQGIATSRHLHTTTLSATGVAEEPVSPSDNHEYEDIISMSTNAAYDIPSRL